MRAFNLFELGIDKHWFSLSDSPEYLERKRTPFVVPNITIAEIRRAVPPELFKKSTFWGLYYVARALISAYVVYKLTLFIPLAAPYVGSVGVWVLWATYWWTQGLVLAGWWCLSHEAGHGGLTNSKFVFIAGELVVPNPFERWLNHILGFCLHTAILAPYYGWRESRKSVLIMNRTQITDDDRSKASQSYYERRTRRELCSAYALGVQSSTAHGGRRGTGGRRTSRIPSRWP